MAAFPASAYDFEENGIYYNILSETDKTCEVANALGEENYAGDITIPNIANGYTVTAIGDQAFMYCTNLMSIDIPQGVTTIGDSAFYECYDLTNIDIPEGVTIIGDYAFNGCTGIKTIKVSGNVGTGAFYNCDSLTTATVYGNVGDKAFCNCINLTTATVSGNIGESAFLACISLERLNLLDGVETIGYNAFSSCRWLTTVVLPKTVKEIGNQAFTTFFKSNLTSVTSLNPVPPLIEKYTFASRRKDMPDTLYVPVGSLEAYKNAEMWKDFPNIIELDPTGIESATANEQLSVAVTSDGIAVSGATGAVEIYTIGGALVTRTNATGGRTEIALPGRGVYIIKVGKQIIKVKR